MKKTFLLLTSLILLLPSSALFAEGSCPIQSGPAEGMKTYLNDMKTLASAASNTSSSCPSGISGQGEKFFDNMAMWSRKSTDFGGFGSSWEFNVFPIYNGKIAKEFYRDHDYLLKQKDQFYKAGKKVATKCGLFTPLSGGEIESLGKKYKLEYGTPSQLLGSMIQLNNQVTAYFRCKVVGSAGGCKGDPENPAIKAVDDGYGINVLNACNKADPSYDKVKNITKDITDGKYGFSKISKGIEDWRKALELLKTAIYASNASDEYLKTEKNLMRTYLARNGIKGSKATAILGNLDCANGKGSDFTLKKCVENRINSMVSGLTSGFVKAYDALFNTEKVQKPSMVFTKDINATKEPHQIVREITNDYFGLLSLMSTENATLDKTISNLVEIHENLLQTNRIIEEGLPTASQTCMLQDQKTSEGCRNN